MKLSTQAFPYPVLSPHENNDTDYKDSSFQCKLNFASEISDNGEFAVEYSCLIINAEIEKLINDGSASFAIDLNCSDTLRREIIFLDREGQIQLDAFNLYGKVEFTPLIVTKKTIQNFTSHDLNEEFGGNKFTLQIGDIIAFDETWVKYFEFNNQSFDSLVKVRMVKEVEKLSYSIETTQTFIYINMGSEMYKLYQELQSPKHKGILGISIFKDVLYLAISDLITNDETENQQWARSFRNKIEELGFSIPDEPDFNSINLMAQSIVHDIGVNKLLKEFKLGEN